MTVSDRIQRMLSLGTRRADPHQRYDLATTDTNVAEIIQIFDDILLRASDNRESTGYRMADAKQIAQYLETPAAWNVVHRGYAQPFLRDACEVAIIQTLGQTLSSEIGVLLLLGLRDSRFLGIPALGSLYCEQVLYVAKRRPSPPMHEVIRLLETLSGEPRPLGWNAEAPWRATLRRLMETYETHLPIPADAPAALDRELPIPAEGSPNQTEDLPIPAPRSEPKTPRSWWKRWISRK